MLFVCPFLLNKEGLAGYTGKILYEWGFYKAFPFRNNRDFSNSQITVFLIIIGWGEMAAISDRLDF